MMRPTLTAAMTAAAVAVLAVSLPGCSAAQPPGFPDLSGLTDVTAEHPLDNPRGGGPAFLFAIPDGYGCSGGGDRVGCDGLMPGMSGIAKRPGVGPCDVGEALADSTSVRLQHYLAQCPGAINGNILNPGQKVSLGSTTCGVLPGDVTACTTGKHGFVLQPSGSFSF